MGKIVYIMGKSSTGKDTIFKELLRKNTYKYRQIVPYTTRPIRQGEKEGHEYHFTDEAGFQRLKEEGKVIEDRAYDTIHGLWRYFTADDGQIDSENNYMTIGTLESYIKICEYYGRDRIIPVLVEIDDGVRLQRALNREKHQSEPKYEEMCRRFLADSKDFSEEKIKAAGITKRFINNELKDCLKEIEEYIHKNME